MTSRRASAFDADLAELDDLAALPLSTRTAQVQSTELAPSQAVANPDNHWRAAPMQAALTLQVSTQEEPVVAVAAEAPLTIRAERPAGNRATQVRLPVDLGTWLSRESQKRGVTLGSIIVAALIEHRAALVVQRAYSQDGLVVTGRTAQHSTPVTLRLTSSQRAMLDEVAREHESTRTAVVVAALRAAADTA